MLILRKKKKLWEVFPIGSPKGALNSRRSYDFKGTIKFKKTDKGVKINRFLVIKDDDEKLYPPSAAIKLFRKQAVFLADKDEDVENFLSSYNISFRYALVCSHCVSKGYMTIINSNFSYKYHKHTICKLCAEEVIKEELKLRGFDVKIFKSFKKLLDKTGNLNTVLNVMDPKFDPLKHSNLTLFDKSTKKTKKFPKYKIESLKLPKKFKDVLIKDDNKYLLPVQALAIQHGLIKGEDLLIVSATASGKTLIGELSGIPKAMDKKKFIFLTPLVALANQKYRDFSGKYSKLGLSTSIKVGANRINAKEEIKLPKSKVSTADIVVGTYEGIDYILRSGKSNSLSPLGAVLIDEIHTLDDDERGSRLNGLIHRLKSLFPDIQIIGLSATVKNSKELADKFSMKLVEYPERPVPLERHVVYVRSDMEKKRLISRLVKKEFNITSKKGFKGQTLIFTNSRKKTHEITNYLNKRHITASAYHAGLSYGKKEKIETNFAKGKISAVVTTAALAAGVDFPASQVIFESLIMGNKWINSNEFSQMLGRAGRPRYHDRGIVYLIPEINNKFDGESEESMALTLLESDLDSVHIDYNEDEALEQILSDISSSSVKNSQDLINKYKKINIPIDIESALDILFSFKMIKTDRNSNLEITDYGKAVSMSFLNIEDAELIRKHISDKKLKDNKFIYKKNNFKKDNNKKNLLSSNLKNNKTHSLPPNLKNNKKNNYKKLNNLLIKNLNKSVVVETAILLESFDNAYLSSRIHSQLVRIIKSNFSTRLFADSTLDIITSGDNIAKLDSNFQDNLIKIQTDFLNCECKDKPFCGCIERNLALFIIKQRLMGKDPIDISRILFKRYHIQTYPGDIFSWLDSIVRSLDAIKRIAFTFKINHIVKESDNLIKVIEG